MNMFLLSLGLIFFVNIIASFNEKLNKKIDIASGTYIWLVICFIISLYNGISFNDGIYYDFEKMKTFNYLLGIFIISSAFFNARVFNPFVIYYVLCILTMVFSYNFFLSLETYGRVIIALSAYSSVFYLFGTSIRLLVR